MKQPPLTLFESLPDRQDDFAASDTLGNSADAIKARVAAIVDRAFASHSPKPLAVASKRTDDGHGEG